MRKDCQRSCNRMPGLYLSSNNYTHYNLSISRDFWFSNLLAYTESKNFRSQIVALHNTTRIRLAFSAAKTGNTGYCVENKKSVHHDCNFAQAHRREWNNEAIRMKNCSRCYRQTRKQPWNNAIQSVKRSLQQHPPNLNINYFGMNKKWNSSSRNSFHFLSFFGTKSPRAVGVRI